MYDIKEVIKKIKEIANIHSNIELARLFNVSYNTLNTWIKRNKFPQEILIKFCQDYNCSLDYLILNTSFKPNPPLTAIFGKNIDTFDFYGEFEPLKIDFYAKLTLKKDFYINGSFYLIKKNEIYFLTQAFFSLDKYNVTLKVNNTSYLLSLDEFKEINLGMIIKIEK